MENLDFDTWAKQQGFNTRKWMKGEEVSGYVDIVTTSAYTGWRHQLARGVSLYPNVTEEQRELLKTAHRLADRRPFIRANIKFFLVGNAHIRKGWYEPGTVKIEDGQRQTVVLNEYIWADEAAYFCDPLLTWWYYE